MTDTKHETKQKASHTPGPWRYESTAEDYDIKAARHGVLVAYTGTNHIDEANASLIAAAPKLLEALETMVRWAELHGLTKAELISGGYAEVPVIGIARKAIAEAKGLAA